MSDSARTPLEAAAGAADQEAVDAFSLLADETRLAILLALWEAYDRPDVDDNAVSFSRLFEAVDYDDPGNFSYHLGKLEGQFVRKCADGYELRNTGLRLVKTIIAGAGVQDTHLEPTDIDRDCELCGAKTAVTYEDGLAYQICTECDGRMQGVDDVPDGYLHSVGFPPAGVPDRRPEELLGAAEVMAYRRMRSMFQGLCDACAGAVDAWLERCEAHTADGVCENCGRTRPVWAVFQCRLCKDFHATSPAVLSELHPAVVAFYYERDVTIRWHATEHGGIAHLGESRPEFEQAIVSEDPLRVVVTVTLDGDGLEVEFDESVSVVDVRR